MEESFGILRKFGVLAVMVVGVIGYFIILLKQRIDAARARRLAKKQERISNLYQRRG